MYVFPLKEVTNDVRKTERELSITPVQKLAMRHCEGLNEHWIDV